MTERAKSANSYALPKSPYRKVSQDTLSYQASHTDKRLAIPKIRKDNHNRSEFSEQDRDPRYTGVYNKAALRYEPTSRVAELAKHKTDYKGYQFELPVMRPVSASAKRFVANERIESLAQPKKRN